MPPFPSIFSTLYLAATMSPMTITRLASYHRPRLGRELAVVILAAPTHLADDEPTRGLRAACADARIDKESAGLATRQSFYELSAAISVSIPRAWPKDDDGVSL